MEIKNDMESLVRGEVRRRKEHAGRNKECWCALCEADVEALALNHLPPRYCQAENYGLAAAQGLNAQVRDVVTKAVDRVSKRPRHRPGVPPRNGDAKVVNFAYEMGNAVVRSALANASSSCGCPQCRADALAIALNRYPPKYGVAYGGRSSYQTNFEDFIRHELGQLIAKAAHIVAANPNH